MGRRKAQRSKPQQKAPTAGGLGWVLWAVTGVTVISGLAFLLSKISMLDEGVLDMGAWRIAQGQVPYRDFFIPTTPLTWYLLGGFFKAVGVGLLQERVFAAAVGWVLVALTLVLAKRVCPDPAFAALPVAFLCQAGMSTWPFANHHWVADVLVLGSAILLHRGVQEVSFPKTSCAGFLAALAFWSLHDQGLYFLLLASALALPWGERTLRKPVAFGWAAGIATGLFPPALFLLWKAGAGNLWEALVLFPLTGYRSLAANRLSIFFPLAEIAVPWKNGAWQSAPTYYLVLTATSLAIVATFFAAPLLLIVAQWQKWGTGHRRGLLAAGTLAFAGAAAHRWGPINLMWAIPFSAIVVSWALQRWEGTPDAPGRRFAKPLVLGLTTLFCLLGVLRVWILLRPGGAHPIVSPAGTLHAQSPQQARALQEAIDRLGVLLEPGDPILVEQMPLLQFMVMHPNPTRFDLFMPPDYTTPEQVGETIRDLEASGTEWVMTPQRRSSQDAFGRYLVASFQPVWGNPTGILWQRKPPPPATP